MINGEEGKKYTDAMNVFIHTVVLNVWTVIVDDVHDVTNVKTTSGDTGSNHDRSTTCLEGTTEGGQ